MGFGVSNMPEGATMVYVQVFLYLQVLDFLTTLVGLKLGISEASPFIRSLMHFGPSMAAAASKIMAIVLAGRCLLFYCRCVLRWIHSWFWAPVFWRFGDTSWALQSLPKTHQ